MVYAIYRHIFKQISINFGGFMHASQHCIIDMYKLKNCFAVLFLGSYNLIGNNSGLFTETVSIFDIGNNSSMFTGTATIFDWQ